MPQREAALRCGITSTGTTRSPPGLQRMASMMKIFVPSPPSCSPALKDGGVAWRGRFRTFGDGGGENTDA